MKSYTDLEQSKKLAEILPLGSADMCYCNDGTSIKLDATPYSVGVTMWKYYLAELIPCWSLAPLLSYLNQDWYVNLSHDGICWQCVIDHHDRKERRCSSVLTDEPVDCCVELIVKLKEEENLI